MSFDKINLPDFLLADLYKEGLVVLDQEARPVKNTDTNTGTPPADAPDTPAIPAAGLNIPVLPGDAPLNYLGRNQKHIAILVNDGNAIHLQDDLLDILTNILTACRLNLADVAILNTAHQQADHTRLKTELAPKVMLLFGVETSAIELPFSIPEYKVQQFGSCNYVQAPSLEKMKGEDREAKLEKSRLWVCLKNLFEL